MADIRDFLLPDLGEGLTEGEILQWLVAVGDRVAVDQPVAEVSTEKAAVQVPTPFAGVVVKLHGQPGEVRAVGTPLISVDVSSSATGVSAPAAAPPEVEGVAAETIPKPNADGAAMSDAVPTPVATTAATDEPQAEAKAGTSGNVLVGYGTSEGGRRRRRVATAPRSSGAPIVPAPATAPPTAARAVTIPSSPLVRRLARELDVDLTQITGTGPAGSVTRADLESFHSRSAATAPAASAAAQALAAPAGGERIPLRGPRRLTAERLSRSHVEIPAATAWLAADATRLLELRDLVNQRQQHVHVTPLAVLLRLVAASLRRYPLLNSSFDAERGETVVASAIHLGVATQTERGLVVAVIRDAQQLSVVSIAAELARLAAAARDSSIDAAELRGSTFTVSNFGAFGVDGGIPIINPPEAAILGVGRIAARPWVVDGSVTARPVVELSVVFDHRVCDGGDAGGFLRLLGDYVEQPGLALAEG